LDRDPEEPTGEGIGRRAATAGCCTPDEVGVPRDVSEPTSSPPLTCSCKINTKC